MAGLVAVFVYESIFCGVGVNLGVLIDICGVAVAGCFAGVIENSCFFRFERWNAAGVGLLR